MELVNIGGATRRGFLITLGSAAFGPLLPGQQRGIAPAGPASYPCGCSLTA